MTPYEFHFEAEKEVLKEVEFYSAIGTELGRRFVAAVNSAISEITKAPEHHPFIKGPARRIGLRKFPFWLIYVKRPDDVLIVALAHVKRKPTYWINRLG